MVKLKDLESEFDGHKIPYSKLLTLEEWKNKRHEILLRDNYTCQKCRADCVEDYIPVVVGHNDPIVILKPVIYDIEEREFEYKDPFSGKVIETYTMPMPVTIVQENPYFPQVHHTYYIQGNMPWDYPSDSLMLLCHECHKKVHEEEVIKVYINNRFSNYEELTPCSRCSGTGYLHEYNHVQNGVCFRCNGACFNEWIS